VSELWRKGAVELAALIRDREVSSREVVQAHLDRIEAVNPALNAIVRLLPDQALAAADAADRTVPDGTTLGPLHGVPFTVSRRPGHGRQVHRASLPGRRRDDRAATRDAHTDRSGRELTSPAPT
jgi:hypothetical protein